MAGHGDGMNSMNHDHEHHTMHMTFFWSKNAEVLFSGWPGTRPPMYALALVVVFAMCVVAEWLSRSQLKGDESGPTHLGMGLGRALVHSIKMGVSYLIMLALMSFNGGVFVAALAGHLVGYLVFGARVFRPAQMPPYVKHTDGDGGGVPPIVPC